jgi:hypothetical protein
LYDVGNLFVCSQNVVTGGATLGELYVDYDIELLTPQLQLPSVDDVDTSVLSSLQGTTGALPLGTNPAIVDSQVSPLLSYNTVSGLITFLKAGKFMFAFNAVGTVVSASTVTGTLGAVITGQRIQSIDTGTGLDLTNFTSSGITVQIGDTVQYVVTATSISAGYLVVTDMGV